ncbi:MAG: hypothetical protein ACYC96_12030 [Fimbriimonadaceae bacterium]
MSNPHNHSDATLYVKSLKDALKRNFAGEYLAWLKGGRQGAMPGRGLLAPAMAKAVCANLEALS